MPTETPPPAPTGVQPGRLVGSILILSNVGGNAHDYNQAHRRFGNMGNDVPMPDWAYWFSDLSGYLGAAGSGTGADFLSNLTSFGSEFVKSTLGNLRNSYSATHASGGGSGDPHCWAFNGQSFDFMAAGEFLYTKVDGKLAPFEVHVRHRPAGGGVAYIGSVAVCAGSTTIQILPGGLNPLVNGVSLPSKPLSLWEFTDKDGNLDAVLIHHLGTFTIIDRQLNAVHIDQWFSSLDLEVIVSYAGLRSAEGVLSSPQQPLKCRDGRILGEHISKAEFADFCRSWALSQSDSLFADHEFQAFQVSASPTLTALDRTTRANWEKQAAQIVGSTGCDVDVAACAFDLAFGGTEFANSYGYYRRATSLKKLLIE